MAAKARKTRKARKGMSDKQARRAAAALRGRGHGDLDIAFLLVFANGI
jgi:hypothetical protein